MCVALDGRRGTRRIPTDAEANLTPAAHGRKARGGRFGAIGQIALSIIWASWPLLTAPIWVASTLPFLNTIRVGMPRTP